MECCWWVLPVLPDLPPAFNCNCVPITTCSTCRLASYAVANRDCRFEGPHQPVVVQQANLRVMDHRLSKPLAILALWSDPPRSTGIVKDGLAPSSLPLQLLMRPLKGPTYSLAHRKCGSSLFAQLKPAAHLISRDFTEILFVPILGAQPSSYWQNGDRWGNC